jgi:ATP-dependent protease ClpP protease subunit/FtsZ-binding cell division protein ZapB
MDKIPFKISARANGPKAEIRIIGTIGWDTDAEGFRTLVDDIITGGVTEAEIYINSPGGSCFDAAEIVNILSRFKKKKCLGGALIASAATYIACSCDEFEIPENAMFMIHPPSGGVVGQRKDFESYLKLLSDIESDYKKLYLSKTNDPKEFNTMWDSCTDYWLTAAETVVKGYATRIKNKVTLDSSTKSLLVACGCPTDKMPIPTLNTKEMDLLANLRKLFGLSDTATDQDVISKIQPLQDEVATLKAQNSKLEGELASFKQKQKESNSSEAKQLLDAAVADGRITAEGRTAYESFFASDHEGAKTALASIQKRTTIKSLIKDGDDKSKEKYAKTWDELDRSGLLTSLKNDDFELFKEKYKERFAKEYKEN